MEHEIEITVKNGDLKKELLEASRHIHDSRDIDTGLPMVNLIAHLHHNPDLIKVADSVEKTDESEYFLHIMPDYRTASIDTKILFRSDESLFRVFLNGCDCGSGKLTSPFGGRIVAENFLTVESLTPQTNVFSCYIRTYNANSARCRQFPLKIKFVDVLEVPQYGTIDDDRR